MCEKNGLHICHSRSPVTLIDKNTSHINRVVMKWFGVFSLPFFPFSLEVEPLLPESTQSLVFPPNVACSVPNPMEKK